MEAGRQQVESPRSNSLCQADMNNLESIAERNPEGRRPTERYSHVALASMRAVTGVLRRVALTQQFHLATKQKLISLQTT